MKPAPLSHCSAQEASFSQQHLMARLKRMLSHRSLAGLTLSKSHSALALLPQTAAVATARRGERT